MFLLPIIEVQKGESIHILNAPGQGEARPLLDPVEVASRFTGMGARGIFLIDVDRCLDPKRDNDIVIDNVLSRTVFPVIVGGGVESLRRIQELLDTGARRVIVGSMGIQNPQWLREAVTIFKELVVPSLDTDGTNVLIKGRQERATLTLDAAISLLDGLGATSIYVTFTGPAKDSQTFALQLAKRLKTPLIYHGPITGMAMLDALSNSNVEGVVVGEEIYNGQIPYESLVNRAT